MRYCRLDVGSAVNTAARGAVACAVDDTVVVVAGVSSRAHVGATVGAAVNAAIETLSEMPLTTHASTDVVGVIADRVSDAAVSAAVGDADSLPLSPLDEK